MKTAFLNTPRSISLFCVAPVFFGLSACGGGGSNFELTTQAPTFNELGAELSGFVAEAELAGIFDPNIAFPTRNDPGALPDTGGPVYNGLVSLIIYEGSTLSAGSDLFIRGDMTVTASFQDDSITGSVGSFSDSDLDTYTGTLGIDGDIRNNPPGSDVTILAGIGGTITNDRTNGQFNLNGLGSTQNAGFAGDFYGPNQEFIFGVIRGELDTPNDGTLLIWDSNTNGIPDGDAIFIGGQ